MTTTKSFVWWVGHLLTECSISRANRNHHRGELHRSEVPVPDGWYRKYVRFYSVIVVIFPISHFPFPFSLFCLVSSTNLRSISHLFNPNNSLRVCIRVPNRIELPLSYEPNAPLVHTVEFHNRTLHQKWFEFEWVGARGATSQQVRCIPAGTCCTEQSASHNDMNAVKRLAVA